MPALKLALYLLAAPAALPALLCAAPFGRAEALGRLLDRTVERLSG